MGQDRVWHGYVDGVFRGGSNREVGTLDLFVPLTQSENELLFADMRGGLADDGSSEGNWGLGYRRMLPSGWIAGMYGFYDLRESAFGNTFHQAMFGAELMDVNWDFRINGYVPDGSAKFAAGGGGGPTGILFSGNNILFSTPAGGEERAYYGMDAEVGRLLYLFGGPLDAEIRGYVGGYYFDNDAAGFPEVAGPRARVELRMFDLPWLGPESRVVLGGEIQYDNVRDTQATGLIQVRVPLGRLFSRGSNLTPLQRRMVEPIIRDIDVVTNSTPSKAQTQIPLTRGSNIVTVTHVNDSGAVGSGTFEDPCGSLTSAAGSTHDIVYVHSGTSFTNQSYAAAANQRVLGEGGGSYQQLQTDQLGRINIPQVNGLGNLRPVIQNPTGTALAGADNSEISNFEITNANTAIELNNLAGNVNVNRTLISGGTTGIDILGGSGTFTFTDVTAADPTGAGIHVNGGLSTINFGGPDNPNNGQFGPSVLTQSGGGTGILVEGGHAGTFNQNPSSPIFADTGDGLQFDNADGNYEFNGPVTLAGGNAGIDILGGSAGTFTFSNTDVTNPTGEGINIDGGDSDVTFGPGSSLTQGNNATGIDIQGGHTGQFTFSGSVNATNGDGLQFDNANGLYEFTGPVTLNGGNAGIDILGGSAGTFTFSNTDITSPTGPGINIDGGDADVTFGPGSSVAQANNATAVNVQGGHTGQMDFGGSVDATMGDGLQFDNANGLYEFTGPVTLNGGNAGIDILSGSGGTFTFSNTDITNPTGEGINVDGGTADVTFGPGSSLTQANNATGINIQGGHNGQFDFGGSVDATNGDGLQFDNANGLYEFTGPVTLNGGDAGIDILSGSGGTFTFSDTTITDPTGVGLNIDGGSADVTFQAPSSITQNTFNQPLIDAMGGHTGTVTFELGTNLEATNGTGLQFMDADGQYIFNGGITLDGTANSADTGIDIITDSAGTFTFTGTFFDPIEITNDQGIAFNMDNSPGTATLDFFDINQSVGAGIRANNSGTLNVFGTDIDNTTGDGINSTNTNLDVYLAGIGINAAIGDDGIEVVNNDGTDRTATITSNNIFPLAGAGIANRGIFINSSGTGTLEADVRFNQVASTNQTILTTSGPTAGSLIVDLQNSTLTTDTPGVFTEEHVGGGLNSTIVRSWDSPNQVIGAVISGTGGGGILFDQVTFDADGNPGNGYQQVQYTGDLDIGSVPPLSITRVTGDGLSFIDPTGDLSIQTLNVANFNGTGLEVDTSGLGTTFNLSVDSGTVDTSGGDAILLNGPNFSLNNTTVTNGATFDTINTTSSTLSGSGNTAGTFNCTDGGGNAGSISFNGGADTCP